MSDNLFLSAYENRIKEIMKELQSISMMSIPTGNIKLSEVANLLQGCTTEIRKQEIKIAELNKKLDEFIEENKKLQDQLFNNNDDKVEDDN